MKASKWTRLETTLLEASSRTDEIGSVDGTCSVASHQLGGGNAQDCKGQSSYRLPY